MQRASAILIIVALSLSACAYWAKGSRKDPFAQCPHVEMLSAAQGFITPPGDDWTVRAEISEYDMQCKVSKKSVAVTITAKLAGERSGDVTERAKQDLPLFVATVKGDNILDKKLFTDTIEFGANRKIKTDSFDIKMEFPLADGENPADKSLIFGYQLDAAQLDYFAAMRQKQVEDALKK